MVSSYTTRNRLNKQGAGDNTNTWGDMLNSGVFDLIDAAMDGWTTVAVSGPVTLTSANGGADQARERVLKLTGTGGTVTLPSVEKSYLVWNAGSGNMIVSVGGATSVTLQPGDVLPALTEGVGVYGLALGGLSLKAYIDSAILATTGSLPATTGNEGKAMLVRSLAWTPSAILVADVSDYATDQATKAAAATARAIAFAAAL